MSSVFTSFNPTSAVLPGIYTIATLPPANINQARYAFCTDLGGGADMVISDGTNWKHIRRGLPGTFSPAATLNVTPLMSPQTLIISGSLTIAMNVNLQVTNLYPGYELTIKRPGVLGLGGSLGLTLGGGSSLFNMLGSSWYDYVYDGTTLQQVRGSSLL